MTWTARTRGLCISLLLALFVSPQAAAAQACHMSAGGMPADATVPAHSAACADAGYCNPPQAFSCCPLPALAQPISQARSAWWDPPSVSDGPASPVEPADEVAARARASRLSRLAPEVRNVSIFLLNLRQ